MPKASELKAGMIVELGGAPHVVQTVQASSPSARGAATLYKVRFAHAQTGQKRDESLKGDDLLPDVDFERRAVQYLYREGDALTFMDVETYAQHALDADQLDDVLPFLVDGMEGLTALIVEDRCVGITVPQIVELEVVETAPAMKGASQSARTKPATLNTGLEIQVPEYLAEGERVKVNTQTRSFQSRA